MTDADALALLPGDQLITATGVNPVLLVRVDEPPRVCVLCVIEGPEPSKPDNYLLVFAEDLIRRATPDDVETLANPVRE